MTYEKRKATKFRAVGSVEVERILGHDDRILSVAGEG
jgi:hypothetical protein